MKIIKKMTPFTIVLLIFLENSFSQTSKVEVINSIIQESKKRTKLLTWQNKLSEQNLALKAFEPNKLSQNKNDQSNKLYEISTPNIYFIDLTDEKTKLVLEKHNITHEELLKSSLKPSLKLGAQGPWLVNKSLELQITPLSALNYSTLELENIYHQIVSLQAKKQFLIQIPSHLLKKLKIQKTKQEDLKNNKEAQEFSKKFKKKPDIVDANIIGFKAQRPKSLDETNPQGFKAKPHQSPASTKKPTTSNAHLDINSTRPLENSSSVPPIQVPSLGQEYIQGLETNFTKFIKSKPSLDQQALYLKKIIDKSKNYKDLEASFKQIYKDSNNNLSGREFISVLKRLELSSKSKTKLDLFFQRDPNFITRFNFRARDIKDFLSLKMFPESSHKKIVKKLLPKISKNNELEELRIPSRWSNLPDSSFSNILKQSKLKLNSTNELFLKCFNKEVSTFF